MLGSILSTGLLSNSAAHGVGPWLEALEPRLMLAAQPTAFVGPVGVSNGTVPDTTLPLVATASANDSGNAVAASAVVPPPFFGAPSNSAFAAPTLSTSPANGSAFSGYSVNGNNVAATVPAAAVLGLNGFTATTIAPRFSATSTSLFSSTPIGAAAVIDSIGANIVISPSAPATIFTPINIPSGYGTLSLSDLSGGLLA